MHFLSEKNPIAAALYFLFVLLLTMFSTNPILIGCSLFGAVLLCVTLKALKSMRIHLLFFLFFLVMSVINPLLNHRGATILFVFCGRPVTLEATLYGVVTAAMMVAVCYWLAAFSKVMTAEKLVYLFSPLSPKLSLILSMSIRFFSGFLRQTKKVNQSQKALGLYRDDNIIDAIRGGLRVFSVTVTWALENGIVTAESMEARGWGLKRRTHYSPFRFYLSDILYLVCSAVLFALSFLMAFKSESIYYPNFLIQTADQSWLIGAAAFFLLSLLPTLLELKEVLRWKYLTSKI